MLREFLQDSRKRFFLLGAAAFAVASVAVSLKDGNKGPALVPGTPLTVYRAHCVSSGNVNGENADWQRYDVSYNPSSKEFTIDAAGKRSVLPPPQIADAIAPGNTDYFMVITQSQVNTASGVAILNVQAVLPMKAGTAKGPLSFQMSVPHGPVLRADACTAID